MTPETYAELMELRFRGAMAAAISFSGVSPSAECWRVLRGETECTLRDMGEIMHMTGLDFEISLSPRDPVIEEGETDEKR